MLGIVCVCKEETKVDNMSRNEEAIIVNVMPT